MLIANHENRSIHISSKNENGEEVLSAHANYSDRSINISFEILNSEYCAANKAEVEEAISAFLGRLNGVLSESELPQVKN